MSETSIIPFDFEGNEFRVERDENGNPLFNASDVCKSAGLDNVSQALTRLDDDEKREIISNDVAGIRGKRPIQYVTESGLYSLVLSSRKPEAKRLKKWVTSEVLPSIRKTGSYSAQEMTPAEIILMQAQRLVDQERRVKALEEQTSQQDNRINRVEARQNAQDQLNAYLTVFAYAALHGLHIDTTSASRIGKRASKYCRAHDIHVQMVKDVRHGAVGSYPEDVLKGLFDSRFEAVSMWD